MAGSTSTRPPRRRKPRSKRGNGNTQPQSTAQSPCYDWTISTASSHYAYRDRAFFTEYAPLPCESSVGHPYFAFTTPMPILGIGTVILELQRSPRTGDSEINTVTLENVLHCPGIVANIFALNIEGKKHHLSSTCGNQMQITNDHQEDWAFALEVKGRCMLKLAHGLQGGGTFDDDAAYAMSVAWPRSEELRVLRLMDEERERTYRERSSRRPEALTGGVG